MVAQRQEQPRSPTSETCAAVWRAGEETTTTHSNIHESRVALGRERAPEAVARNIRRGLQSTHNTAQAARKVACEPVGVNVPVTIDTMGVYRSEQSCDPKSARQRLCQQ